MIDRPTEGAVKAASHIAVVTFEIEPSVAAISEAQNKIDQLAVAPAVRELVIRLDYLVQTSDQLDKCLVEFSEDMGACGEYWEVWQEALIRAEKCIEKHRHLMQDDLDKAG